MFTDYSRAQKAFFFIRLFGTLVASLNFAASLTYLTHMEFGTTKLYNAFKGMIIARVAIIGALTLYFLLIRTQEDI